jgi:hypothetical protein
VKRYEAFTGSSVSKFQNLINNADILVQALIALPRIYFPTQGAITSGPSTALLRPRK